MKELKYVITDKLGIHARPAGLLAKAAASFECNVKIIADEKEADARRLLALMKLGIKQNDEITIRCDGPDEDAAIEKLSAFLEENL